MQGSRDGDTEEKRWRYDGRGGKVDADERNGSDRFKREVATEK